MKSNMGVSDHNLRTGLNMGGTFRIDALQQWVTCETAPGTVPGKATGTVPGTAEQRPARRVHPGFVSLRPSSSVVAIDGDVDAELELGVPRKGTPGTAPHERELRSYAAPTRCNHARPSADQNPAFG